MIEQEGDIVLGAGKQVIQTNDVVTFVQQAFATCEPRKPVPPGVLPF